MDGSPRVTVRPGGSRDAGEIAAIYNDGIAERVATFETRWRSVEDVRAWFGGRHILLVAELDGRVVGFTVTHPYSVRECYSGVHEFSVYVAREARRHGAGRQLIAAMMEAAAERGWWKLIGRIFAEMRQAVRWWRGWGSARSACTSGMRSWMASGVTSCWWSAAYAPQSANRGSSTVTPCWAGADTRRLCLADFVRSTRRHYVPVPGRSTGL
jgi:phosphinothricin acetyltransferase